MALHKTILGLILHFLSRFKPYILPTSIVLVLAIILELARPNIDIEMFHNIVLYTSTAAIQAYAALVAIPFTIAVVHLQSMYGSIVVRFLSRYLLRAFITLGIVFITSFSIMVIDGTRITEQNTNIMYIALVVLAAVLLLPIPSMVNYIKSLFILMPSNIVESLLKNTKIPKKLSIDMHYELGETLSRAFFLAGLSIMDPSSELEFYKVATKISDFLNTRIIPYIKRLPINENTKDEEAARRLVLLIFELLNRYIVTYLRYSKTQRPLIPANKIYPLVKAVNDIVRIAILKGIIAFGREYYIFVHNLGDIMSLYLEDKRIDEALSLYLEVYSRLLKSKDNILDLESIQKKMLSKPRRYREENLLPSTYDFYIDYAAAIPCMLFKLLLEEIPREDLKHIGEKLLSVMLILSDYPVLLAGYTFDTRSYSYPSYPRTCADYIAELMLEQDEVYEPHLLALLIAWITKAYIVAENILNEDDKRQVIKNIIAISSKLLKYASEQKYVIKVIIYPPPSNELKLVFKGRTAPLSRYIRDRKSIFAKLISKYDNKKICNILKNILEPKTVNC